MSTSNFVRGLIVAYMDLGFSSRETEKKICNLVQKYRKRDQMVDEDVIAEINVSHNTCANIFKRFQEELSYKDRRQNNGSDAIYTEEEQTNIGQMVDERIGLSMKEIVTDININPKEASRFAIRDIFDRQEVKCYKQTCVVKPTEEQKSARLRFASKHLRWRDHWQKVIFSDESQISISPSNKFYYAKQKQDIDINLMKNKESYPLKVHVWGAISFQQPLELVLIEGNLNSKGYLNMLEQFYEKHLQLFEKGYIFQQDNSRVHTAGIIVDFLDSNAQTLEWPPASPDLSPIENIWSIIKEELWFYKDHINTKDDLFNAAEDIFYHSPTIQEAITNAYTSLPSRLQNLIDKQGEQI
ncbi:hypothetical protein ABPG72_004912 [Tetrahymena utriculariae]